MNLAGPVNGFWLGHALTANHLTANFFLRGGYEGNPVLSELVGGERRARTAGALMTRMGEIMRGERCRRDGSREIARIFDELAGGNPPSLDVSFCRAAENHSIPTVRCDVGLP
jgi:hypothetical protein